MWLQQAHDMRNIVLSRKENDRRCQMQNIIRQEKVFETAPSCFCGMDVLKRFYPHTIQNKSASVIPTGFSNLDEHLNGGLTEGLYFLGAISSLGKTTLALQMADQIAQQGYDVLFFSLEMSRYELVAKSLSRWTYQLNHHTKTKNGWMLAKETSKLLHFDYSMYSREENEAVQEAIKWYEKAGKHMYFFEGQLHGERIGVDHIKEAVEQHTILTRKKPVVFVDYLQILAPADMRASDKRNIDTAVFELKTISRNFGIPVFVISSFNRQSYEEPVTMLSFKESGAIEYSSDVLFGLQYAGMDYKDGESDKNRKERLRCLFDTVYHAKRNKAMVDVELKCLKNRNGYQFSTEFAMNPAFNYFRDDNHANHIKEPFSELLEKGVK